MPDGVVHGRDEDAASRWGPSPLPHQPCLGDNPGVSTSDAPFPDRDEVPTVEVRVFRHGTLVHRELVESEEQAALVVDDWAELDGVQCEVDDLSIRHRPGEVLEPELAELPDEDHEH